jgi:hypothetical protein
MRYIVREITGEFALSFDDGQQLFDLIHPQLLVGQTVELDFAGVTSVSTAFPWGICIDRVNGTLTQTSAKPATIVIR